MSEKKEAYYSLFHCWLEILLMNEMAFILNQKNDLRCCI